MLSQPGKTYHIEHFRPQHAYREMAVAYENLFLSCGTEDGEGQPAPTCGNFKGNWFDEAAHIYPAYSECTSHFRFMLNGEVVAAEEGDLAAANMIAHLNLNLPELRKGRKDILLMVDEGTLTKDDFWDANSETAESYAHVVFQHSNQIIP